VKRCDLERLGRDMKDTMINSSRQTYPEVFEDEDGQVSERKDGVSVTVELYLRRYIERCCADHYGHGFVTKVEL
jgi:hypothetical protein